MLTQSNIAERATRLAGMPAVCPLRGYAWGVAAPFICTVVNWPMRDLLGQPSILMIYLLGVFLVATCYGFGAAILASLLSAPLFAYYFARPIFSFAISDLENMVGLAVMIVVANLTSNLQDKARQQAELALQRERRTNALYQLSQALADASDQMAVARVAVQHIYDQFGAQSVLLFADDQGKLIYPDGDPLACSLRHVSLSGAQGAFQLDKDLPQSTPDSPFFYPLERSQSALALLAIHSQNGPLDADPNLSGFFATFRSLIAQTLQRLHFAEQAKSATLQAETEALRNALLSAISHDLRTPLTRITGAAGALIESGNDCTDEDRQDFGKVIFDEAQRMSDLTGKILNMARLSSGKIILHQDWNALEEIVGSALTRLNNSLLDRPVRTQLPNSLPLVWIDAVLLEQVLINLIENAIKYTPAGSPIDISAEKLPTGLQLVVSDYGHGIPKNMEEKLFEKFYSLETETQEGGVGLGLALCRAIIEAHGGSMRAANVVGKGAAFIMDLPLLEPPILNWEDAGMHTV
ncbi:phospho-acceptor domain-containing protein [Methylomonas methanica]|nr:phospho-acceptor domain-containing protein [Methylomonas methanica]